MMNHGTVLLQTEGELAIITLNRPRSCATPFLAGADRRPDGDLGLGGEQGA